MQRRRYLAVLGAAWLAGCEDITIKSTPEPTTVAEALPAEEFERRFEDAATEFGMNEGFELSVPSKTRAVVTYSATRASRHDKEDALWNALVELVSTYGDTHDLEARVRRESGAEWYRWKFKSEWAAAYERNELDGDALRERIQGTIQTA